MAGDMGIVTRMRRNEKKALATYINCYFSWSSVIDKDGLTNR